MERVNIVVLASLAAALTLLGLRILTDHAAPHFVTSADASGPGMGPDDVHDRRLPRSRIAMYGGETKPTPQGGTPGAESRRESRRGAGGQAELIADLERRRRDRFDAAFVDGVETGDVPDSDESDLVPGRSAGIPRAGSSLQAPPQPQPEPEVVEEPPKDTGGAEVLLRIPFDGDVVAEVGGGAFETDGLVTGDGRVDFPEEAQLSFPSGGNVNSETGTIAFEMRPHWEGSDETNNSFVQIRTEHDWENRLQIVKNDDALRFIIVDSGGVERNINVTIDDWRAGDPRIITAAWDATSMRLYLNGDLVGQSTLPHPLRFGDTTPMFIGSDYPGSSYVGAGGSISDFVVYGRALGADEITRQ